jgi:hypothetical protein
VTLELVLGMMACRTIYFSRLDPTEQVVPASQTAPTPLSWAFLRVLHYLPPEEAHALLTSGAWATSDVSYRLALGAISTHFAAAAASHSAQLDASANSQAVFAALFTTFRGLARGGVAGQRALKLLQLGVHLLYSRQETVQHCATLEEGAAAPVEEDCIDVSAPTGPPPPAHTGSRDDTLA